MDLNHHIAAAIVQDYFSVNFPLKRLGWGIGGYVYLSPDALTAVKVHNGVEGFEREVEVYKRLQRLRMTQLHGLTIPRLWDHRDDLRLIQMDLVRPPFLLDFAGVLYRSVETEFDADRLDDWHKRIAAAYGRNAWVAYGVYNSLGRHGMYYVDFRPTNLNVTGLPGMEPAAPDAAEDIEY